MWKKFALTVVLLMTLMAFIPTATALAAPELKVGVSAGLDGKAKYGKGAPVTLTIENSGTPFSGDMVIDMPYTYSVGMGEAFPLEIGTGETKKISFVLPRMNDRGSMRTKTIFFYEDGWEKGKEITHKGSQQIASTLHAEDAKFGVLFTDNVDRLAALKTVRYGNGSSIVLMNSAKIGASKFPEEADGWGAANFIVIDEYPLADLSSKQQEALMGWVRDGGIIIIGGSDNSHVEAGLFADYLPLTLHGMTEMNTATLNNWAGTEGFEGMIPTSKSELTLNGQPLIEDGHNVLAAYVRLGEGLIIQTAFSVGDEPLAKMEGMTALWDKLFEIGERKIQVNPTSNHYYYDGPIEAITSSIGNANALFPSFKVSAPLILGIILLYIIVIIPVLYFILKKKDKREYTWWLVPAIAVLTSVAIFAYGAKDRIGRAQLQHTAVLNVGQGGDMTGYYAESLLTNKSGDFAFTAPMGTTLFASTRGEDLFGSSSLSIHKRAMLEKDVAGSTLHLRNTGYWDVATIYGETTVEKVGAYESKLSIEDKQLTGTVTNDFPFALTDVAIWSGSTLIPLGDMGPGETVQVDETLKTGTLLPRHSLFNPYMSVAPTHSNDLTQMRKDGILSFSEEQMNNTAKPVIIGYTDTQLVPIELAQVKPAISSLTMIAQPIEVDVTFEDSVTIVSEMMTMSLFSEGTHRVADSVGYGAGEYYFHEPAYLQVWKVPEELKGKQLNWTSLEVSKIQKQLYEVSILNVRTGIFEQQDTSKFTLTGKLDDYITPDGEIVLRLFLKDAQNGGQGRAPELKLNGEVAK